MQTIKQILMERDGLSAAEAAAEIAEAKAQLAEYLDEGDQLAALNICEEFFGLESDYLDELLWPGLPN